MDSAAVKVERLSHAYGARQALCELSLEVAPGEVFALLGPNGSGKTTLFRVLSTLARIQSGKAFIFGADVQSDVQAVRRSIGVVFQAPSLDKKLTVAENVRHQAALYGLSGAEVRERERDLLMQLGVADRAKERAETLSGGLRRRVELAKGMIHRPRLLLLDEPSAGLDPGARADLWACLRQLQREYGVTILFTTHLLDEADKASRIAIVSDGRLVALDTPAALRATVGGDTITIETDQPDEVIAAVREKFAIEGRIVDGSVRLEQAEGHRLLSQVAQAMPGQFSSIRLGRPTLEDVFIDKTGKRFWQADES